MSVENNNLNAKINLIKSSDYYIKLRDDILKIKVEETETSALFFTLIILFLFDALFILFYFQLSKIMEGLISLGIEVILLMLLSFTYSQYKDVQTNWEINPLNKEILIQKQYKNHIKENKLKFRNIESIAISQGRLLTERYNLSILFDNSIRLTIIRDKKNNCKLIGKKISQLANKPLYEREFFKTTILYVNFIFVYLIIIAIILYLMDLELMFRLILILFFRNALLLLSFIDIYLIREWVSEFRIYKKNIEEYQIQPIND